MPDSAGLLTAEFSRRGPDLAIGSADTPALVILDYFVADTAPDLITSGGAVLPGRIVSTLAGPGAPGHSTDAAAQQPIGHVEQLDGEVVIIRADGTRVVAAEGTPLLQDDVVTTDGDGAVGLRFVDGMTLSLGSDARMVLDEFAYDPEAGEGGGLIEVIQGAFSFVSGKAAHVGLDSLVIDTPTMTIGIRGTKVIAQAAAEGETTTVVLLPEDDGTLGKIMVSTESGQELLEQAFISTTVTSRFLPPAPQTFVTPEWVYSQFSKPLAYLPTPTQESDSPSNQGNEVDNLANDVEGSEEAALSEQLAPREWFGQASPVQTPNQVPEQASPDGIARQGGEPVATDASLIRVAQAEPQQHPASSPLPASVDQQPPETTNQAPVVVRPIADASSAEDAIFSYDISGSFADADAIDGDSLTFSATQSGGAPLPAWLAIDPFTGVLVGTPANADVGGLTLAVTATDDAGASATSSFQLTVNNTNDAPVVVQPLGDISPTQGVALDYDVSGSFADDDAVHGDSLTFSATQSGGAPLPAWVAIDPVTGVLFGTPGPGDVGSSFVVDVMATDSVGANATASFQLTVDNVNDAPVVVVPIADNGTAEDAVFSYDVSGNFADADGEALTYTATQAGGAPLPSWLAIDPVTGVLSGTPANADVGGLTIDVTATDGAGANATSSFQLTVTNTNDAPVVVTPIGDTNTAEDAVFSYDVSGNFADADTVHGDTLAFSATQSGGAPLPAWLAIDAVTGVLSGTPTNGDVGALTIDVTATDGVGANTISSFQLTVTNTNDAPVVVTPIGDTNTAEDAAFSYDVSGSFADVDAVHGDTLTFSATQSGGAPLPAWLAIDPVTGVLSGTPANADVGGLTIDVTATDGASANTTSSFQLTVTNTNDAPVVVTPIGDTSTAEDAAFSYDVSGNFADADTVHGDTLAFSATQSGGAPLPAWLAIDVVTGVLSGTPNNGDVGGLTVDVTATDGAGANTTSSFQLTVTNTNDAPVVNVTANPALTAIAADTTDPAGDTVADIVIDGSITDVDGAAVEAIAVTGVDDTNGSWEYSTDGGANWSLLAGVSDSSALLLGASAKLRFTPDPSFEGQATFTFRAWDQTVGSSGEIVDASVNGGSTAYSALSDTASITVLAQELNFGSGSEFQINTNTAKEQQDPSLVGLSDGGFVVTWQSKDQDGDNWGVYGQRFDSDGTAVGSEFQINTSTTKEQQDPSVAALSGGGFIVTWQSKDQDGDNWGVYGQRYDAAGNAAGTEFQINTYTAKEQQSPAIAALSDGGFVVTWQSKDQDGDNWGVYGQRYDATGNAIGGEFQINTTTVKEQQAPSVATLADGSFVVTWQSKDQDGDNWGVYGQRYDAAGNAAGTEFQINTNTAKEQQNPSVAALSDGGFVVTWQSKDQDGNAEGIFGQRFDVAGNPVEFEFQVNTEFSKDQQDPAVAGLSDGGFLVTWQSKDQDGDNWGIYGQRFNADGDAIGPELLINTTAGNEQTTPDLAILSDGDLVAAWQSKDQDGDDWGVYGHQYESELASVTINPPQGAAASMLDFGSSNSFVAAGDPGPSSDALDPGTQDFTVEAWFYYAGPNGIQSIVSKGNATEADVGFNVFLDGSELVARVTTEAGDAAASKVTLSGADGWYHVAMVIEQEAGGDASQVKGYLDGSDAGWSAGHGTILDNTFTTLPGGIHNADSFSVGAVDNGGATSNYFDAEIADVRVWNTARSAAEIQADLGRTLNGDEAHLIANWRLDDGAGVTAVDSGPGGYDGTLGGGAAWESATGFTIPRDTSVAGRISATDPEGDALSYGIAAGPTNGTAAIDPQSGTWTYTPDAGYSGGDSVSYQVSDGNGGSDTVNIAITVTP